MEIIKYVVIYKNDEIEHIVCNTEEERERKISYLLYTNKKNIKKLSKINMQNNNIIKTQKII